MLEPCANTLALQQHERDQEAAERAHEADYRLALSEAHSEAQIICRSAELMGEAALESKDVCETAKALCVLLVSKDTDDRRKARQVVADAVANLACWRTGNTLRGLLSKADQNEVACRIAEVLP